MAVGLEKVFQAIDGHLEADTETCSDGYQAVSAKPANGFVYKDHIEILSREEALEKLPHIAKKIKRLLKQYWPE